MAEITIAADETAANSLIDTGIALIPPQNAAGSGNLGPFVANYAVSATLVNGDVEFIPPDIIRLVDLQVNWSINLSFGIDLSTFLPDFCLPQVCVRIPCVGRVCTPRICIDWPTITVPVAFSDFVRATGDFRINVALVGGNWEVTAVIVGVPNLQLGATSALLLSAIGLAITPLLVAIPFIGPFLAVAVNAILLAIGVAGVTGLLGPIITPFVSGLKIPVYKQSQLFQVLPLESAIDPAVGIVIDQISARVENDGEDELILTADISA